MKQKYEKSLKMARKEVREKCKDDWKIRSYGCYISYRKGIGYYCTDRCTDKFTKYLCYKDGKLEEIKNKER